MKRLLVFFLILLFQYGFPYALSADSTIKVGVYNNKPLLFSDAAGKGKGVFADIIEQVASKEGWRIEYVTGTWNQCLSRLENNQIDILGTIGFTSTRDRLYDFGKENLMTNWGQLYTLAGSDIKAITDVAGKKVAAMRGDIHYRVFAQIIDKFGLKCEFIETDNYCSVLELVSRNQADAGVVNRFFGMKYGSKYKLDKSGVIFNPIKLYYAVPEGKNKKIIDTIDRYIVSLKGNENSEYYRSLDRWFEAVSVKQVLPKWAKWTISVSLGLVIVFFLGNLVLGIRVKAKTKELTAELNERRKTEEALRESEEKYKSLYEKSADAVLIYKDRKFIDCNQAAIDMLDMKSKERFYNCSAADISPEFQPDGRRSEEKSAEMDAIAFEKGSHRFEWLHKRATGEEFPVEVMLTSIKEHDEMYFHVIWRDITERKQTEVELAKHHDHLEEIVRERTAELKDKNKELERYNRLFEGREFRIKELKDKIEALEKRLI